MLEKQLQTEGKLCCILEDEYSAKQRKNPGSPVTLGHIDTLRLTGV